MKLILGLIGAPSVGKSEIADFFVKKGFIKKAFADKIKEEYYALTGYTEEIFKSSRGQLKEEEIRSGLWKYSKEKINEYGSLYFINPVINEIKEAKTNVIISDIRTTDELAEATKINIKIIYIYKEKSNLKNDDIIPGTKIKFKEMNEVCYASFMNNFNSLEEMYKDLERFYGGLIIGV